MDNRFDGKTVLVTGSTSGIGRAAAHLFACKGARVVITGRDRARGTAVERSINGLGGHATFISGDLRSGPGVRELLTSVHAAVGEVDVLVNNAGVFPVASAAEATESLFDEVFAVNVRAPTILVAHLAPGMASRGTGAIVNVTSLASERGLPLMGMYGASKSALAALNRAWAAEFGPSGVRVNAVSPALVRTEGTSDIADLQDANAQRSPSRRPGRPEDVANAIVFLADEETLHMHGTILPVDGGLSAI